MTLNTLVDSLLPQSEENMGLKGLELTGPFIVVRDIWLNSLIALLRLPCCWCWCTLGYCAFFFLRRSVVLCLAPRVPQQRMRYSAEHTTTTIINYHVTNRHVPVIDRGALLAQATTIDTAQYRQRGFNGNNPSQIRSF